jgi:anaerobic selenocysteine-containing dehydrogenase
MTALAATAAKFPGPSSLVPMPATLKAAGQEEIVYSWCRQCALPPCGIKVRVQDGVAVQLEGDSQAPTNQGRLCARGNATIMALYNPYRVKTPLKRTNPQKGLDQDPKWQEISWDEALGAFAQDLKRIRADNPKKFIWNNGFARSGSMLEGMEFCEAYGTPNYIEVDGPTCSVHFGSSLLLGNFTGPVYDSKLTEFVITMGQNSNAGGGYAPAGFEFAEAVDRGMRSVVIDPRNTVEGSKGEWVPIRPGTDLAFVLAFQQVIVHEIKTLDVQFLKLRTNGPYLIGPNGHYVRDAATKKPLIWDPTASKAKTFDDPTNKDYALEGEFSVDGVPAVPGFQLYKQAIKQYTPEWAEQKTSIPAATVRRLAQEFVDRAQIGKTITMEGTPMPFRPVCLQAGRGAITQYYGANLHSNVVLANMLVGALDVPGGGRGGLGPQHKSTPVAAALTPTPDGVVAPKVEAVPRKFEYPPQQIDGKTYFPYSHDNPHITFHAILNPEVHNLPYQPEIMFIWAGNAVLRMYRQEPVIQAMRKMKAIYALSYSLDEPTQMADIVFPESTGLERYSTGGGAAIVPTPDGPKQVVARLVAQQVVKPLYNTKQPDEVFMELADRVGILSGPKGVLDLLNGGKHAPIPAFKDPFKLALDKKYTPKELANLVLKSDYGPDADVDKLRNKASCMTRVVPNKAAYGYLSFPMGKTRYAIYMDHMKQMGEDLIANFKASNVKVPGWTIENMAKHYSAIPVWLDPVRPDPAGFDLNSINWKTGVFSFGVGGSLENPWLRETSELYDPYALDICINPKTAQVRGLNNGDLVWVESEYGGKVQGRLKLSELFHPEVVGIAGMYGHSSQQLSEIARKGIHYNTLMSSEPADIDPVSGGFDGAPRIKVYKA